MRVSDLAEAAGLLRRLIIVMRSLVGSAAATSAFYQSALNDLDGRAEIEIEGGTLAAPLGAAFEQAFDTGASPEDFAGVRIAAAEETISGGPAIVIRQAVVRLALYWQVAALAKVEISSRDEIEAYRADLNAAFEQAEEDAADQGETEVYREFIAAHGRAIQDLMDRGRTLPRLVDYAFPISLPVVTIANRLYGDADRVDELVRENGIVHPLFAPITLRALTK
jgi:hypothetical protein